MRAEGLVMEGLATTADRTRMNVVSNEHDHSGPVELAMDILDRLGDCQVSSQAVVVMGVKDVQSGLLIVRDIESPL